MKHNNTPPQHRWHWFEGWPENPQDRLTMAVTDYDYVAALGKCGCEFTDKQQRALYRMLNITSREEKRALAEIANRRKA